MNKQIANALIAVSILTTVIVCGGCQSGAEEATTPTPPAVDQAAPNAASQMPPQTSGQK